MTTATLRISTPLPEARTAPQKSLLKRFFDALTARAHAPGDARTRAAPPPAAASIC